MSYILKGLLSFGKLLMKSKRFLPGSIAGLFVLIQFFIDLFKVGLSYAFKNLSLSLLAAEYQINKAVSLAIQDSSQYDLGMFISIVSSIFILFFFIKGIAKVLIKFGGSQSPWASYIISIAIMGIIEIATVKIVDGAFGFIPLVNGIWYLLVNLGPVLTNIHFF